MISLRANGLSKRYRTALALRDCTVELPAGRVIALVGPNGAGKTTLLRMAVGLIRPTSGSVTVFGESPATNTAEALSRFAFVAQEHPLYRRFTVADLLRFGRSCNIRWTQELAEHRLSQLDIPLSRRAGALSGGQQAQVALALALAKQPDLLVLDEPLASLDPLARREFLQTLMGAVEERCVLAGDARFVGEISKLFADLPAPHPEPDAEIRIGDTERNEARALLDIHLSEGRLTYGEHEERCTLAGTARVKLDVADLFTDLPAPHPDLSSVVRPRQPEHKDIATIPPTEPTNPAEFPESPASAALVALAVLALFFGLPATVAVTIVWGAWWTLLANVLLGITSLAVAIAIDKPKNPTQQGEPPEPTT